jgi:hypothetical protein
VKNKYVLGIWIGLAFLGCSAPIVSLAYCQNSNATAQQQCLAQEAQQRAQQQAQQQAEQRAQQEAQQRAQQEAQQRAQQQVQQRAQQEAQQRAQQEAQQRAQQEAQERAQQEAQQRAQQEAQQRAQQEAQQRSQQQAQQQARQRAQQEAQQHAAQQQAQQESSKRATQQAQQPSPQHAPQPAKQSQDAQPRAAQSPPRPANPPAPGMQPHATVRTEPTSTPGGAPAGGAGSGVHAAIRPEPAAPHPAAPAPRPIQINATTKAIVRPGSSVVTVRHTTPNGSQVVMNRQVVRGKTTVASAYLVRHDANGDRSKTYLDGRKVVYARNGDIARTSPNGVTVVTHKSGLRQAALADGRPIFREHIEHVTHGAVSREVVVRTEYAGVVIGRPVFYAVPVIRHYDVLSYYGFPVLAYQPAILSPLFFGPFLVGFAQPVVVTAACVFCPAPVVAWQQPVASYSDPVDLVADMQITSAVQDGLADAPSATLDAPSAQEDPQVAELRAQVSAMQQQVDDATQSNAELRNQVTALQQSNSPPVTAAFTVPEAVRQQIHHQVRDNIRLHQQKRALTWPDVVASGDAPNYIFQVSDMLDATDNSGEECPLTAGDLLKLDSGAAPDQEVLSLRVVTSKSGSCPAGSLISVSIHDAQGMLNDFNQRQEANMQKLQPQIALASKG